MRRLPLLAPVLLLHLAATPPGAFAAQADTLHGTVVADPYRWLEHGDARTARWVEAQDSSTRAFLRADPRYAQLRSRLAELQVKSGIRLPIEAGGRLFYFGTLAAGGTRASPNVYVQDGLRGAPTPLILDESFRFDLLIDVRPSPTGRHVALGMRSEPGSSWITWHILDVARRELLPDRLDGAFLLEDFVWSPDGSLVYYGRFDPPSGAGERSALRRGHRIVRHRVGSAPSDDRVVLALDPAADREIALGVTPEGGSLVVVARETDGLSSRVALLDVATPTRPLELVADVPGRFRFLGVRAGALLFYTTVGASRGRVVSIRRESPSSWSTVVPERDAAILPGGQGQAAPVLVGDRLVIPYQQDLRVVLAIVDLRDGGTREVPVPEGGMLFNSGGGNPLAGAPRLRSLFVQFIGITDPLAIFRIALADGRRSVFFRPALPFDPERFETLRVHYPGADGTRIPMSITRRKGIRADGTHPAILHAYGADGFVMMPFYRPWFMAWLERGGIFAIANVRGGGEYGASWHEAAIGPTKTRTLDDYIAAADWLVREGHAARGRLVGNAVSAGGYLPAMLAIRRPALVGAALIDYPLLDLVRYERFAGGGFRDFGTVADRATFDALRASSPYANLGERPCLPPLLVLTSDTDDQAPPLHAYKFLARAQAGQRCSAPLLLDLVRGSGHAAYGSRGYPVLDTMTDQLLFLVKVLALDG